ARAQASLPVVVYASRTHSQLSQVQRELGRAGFKVRSAVLSSRAQTCLNPAVKTLPQSTAGRVCRGLMQKRACRHYLGVDPYLKAEPEAGLAVRDLEELVRLGTQRTLCPFVLSRQLATDADVLFVPYNYLIEPAKRRSLSVPWERAVLVFDEAHNLESACSDAASFDLPAATLGAAVEELGTAAELALLRDEGGQGSQKKEDKSAAETSAELRQAQIILRKLEQAIAELDVPKTGRTEPGAFLFQLFAKVRLTPETWPLLASAFETALDVLTQNASEAGRSSGSRSSSYRLHAVSDALSLAFETCPPPGEGGDSRDSSAASPSAHLGYRVHVHLEQSRSQGFPLPTLSFWCFAPGQALKALQQLSVRSVLLTSGTLSPLGSFAAELGLPFRHRLENPHVIDPSQVWVGVVPRGPTGAALNSSFLTRDSPEYRRDLGAAVVNFARIVPDGMLVFFASYGLLTSAVEAWQASPAGGESVWDRIARHKSPIVEPRDAALFGQAVADFKAKLDAPGSKGAVLFAVCR
ncbi:DEAD2 domain-containing protein, partial [Helicosporidium sp. ATCC 50920]